MESLLVGYYLPLTAWYGKKPLYDVSGSPIAPENFDVEQLADTVCEYHFNSGLIGMV